MEQRRDFRQSRNHRSPDGDHNSNWAISYGDMITLLLAFFVLFFNLKKTESFELKLVEKELAHNFANNQGESSIITWGKMDDIDQIKTKISGDKLIVEFPNISFFNTADSELTEAGNRVLTKFAETFREKIENMRLVVRGYTDNRPLFGRGPYKDNLELSMFRSLSALRLLGQNGIPLYLMRTGGYGETDKAQEISPGDQLKYDRKIVLVLEPLDSTERGIASTTSKEINK